VHTDQAFIETAKMIFEKIQNQEISLNDDMTSGVKVGTLLKDDKNNGGSASGGGNRVKIGSGGSEQPKRGCCGG
jgi:hypothetical protein